MNRTTISADIVSSTNLKKTQESKLEEKLNELLVILQFIAHFLADFCLQSQKWCDRKESKVISAVHLYHCLRVFILSYPFSFKFVFWRVALIISVSHLLIDSSKNYCLSRNYLKEYLFFIDQMLHIVIICCVCCRYLQNSNSTLNTENNIDKYAYILLALIIRGKSANVFIKKYIESNKIEIKKNRKNENIVTKEEEEELLFQIIN
jgi:hypothetical protein